MKWKWLKIAGFDNGVRVRLAETCRQPSLLFGGWLIAGSAHNLSSHTLGSQHSVVCAANTALRLALDTDWNSTQDRSQMLLCTVLGDSGVGKWWIFQMHLNSGSQIHSFLETTKDMYFKENFPLWVWHFLSTLHILTYLVLTTATRERYY